MVLFFFMMVFMDTTATIPTGAMAERWAWKNFCLFGLWVALPYCLYANWVWDGGWLAQGGVNWGLGHGAVDFAGSGVVHTMGGVIALAGTDLRISFIVVNTMVAGIVASLATMVTLMLKGLKPDPTMCCNGLLAGLVAITAPCAFVSPISAVIIGAVAGWLVVVSVFFWERRGIDDPVGAISVHGVNGLWGVLAVGIFATGEYGAGWMGQASGLVHSEGTRLTRLRLSPKLFPCKASPVG
jgi:Amt family ammonium transporter